jgi:uncharacterized protein
MPRKDREMSDPAEWREVLDCADSVRIGFAVENEPYIVAMNFGYRWKDRLSLYFHSGHGGRKLECMAKNDRVCFQMDADRRIVRAGKACEWGMEYRSLVGTGRLVRVTETEEKIAGLNRILAHYGDAEDHEYDGGALDAVEVLRLDVESVSGKKRPGPYPV